MLKRERYARPYLLCTLFGAGALVAGCTGRSATAIVAAENRNAAPASTRVRERQVIRATGLVQALESQTIRVPQLNTSGGRITLTRIVENGSRVSKGDVLVEFDRTTILDEERDAKALLNDLKHQLEDKRAQSKSDAAKRTSQIREAEADLEKAELQLRKGPVLSDIDRLKNEAKAEFSRQRVASLRKSDELRRLSEGAGERVLELKVERQQLTLERIQHNLDRMQVKAPQDGMTALENTWRQGSMGPPQEGDQVWPGLPLLKIFNPASMVVRATVDEPDFAPVSSATKARVFLDAYPGAVFDATLESASPVATSGIDSPVRNFSAVFRIAQQSPQLLPDLSAALEIERPGEPRLAQ